MRRCFELAGRGMGQVSPNPMVGAVLVKNGTIIGEGWHTHHGAPHAEPACFANASEDVTDATLYVNLEPCCHTKKLTPPCSPLVISKKVAQVVISNLDPNPQVAGLGVEQLKAAGIDVVTGILETEGEELNEIFFHRMRTGLPFVHLKTAMSLDGKSARLDGKQQWITGPNARLDSHWGRLSCDAIVVGAQTVRSDNTSLTIRLPEYQVKRAPWRIVLTVSGNLPMEAKIFTDELKHRTLVVCQRDVAIAFPETQILRLSNLTPFPFGEFYLHLKERNIFSLLLEGGADLHDLFLSSHQVQRITVYRSSALLGAGKAAFKTPMPALKSLTHMNLGDDERISGVVV